MRADGQIDMTKLKSVFAILRTRLKKFALVCTLARKNGQGDTIEEGEIDRHVALCTWRG
jgi:hypothetical protein